MRKTPTFCAFDNFRCLEADWGAPRDRWTLKQWKNAAAFVNQSAELLDEIADSKEQCIATLEEMLDTALEQIPVKKKRGRPSKLTNYLYRRRPPTARTASRERSP